MKIKKMKKEKIINIIKKVRTIGNYCEICGSKNNLSLHHIDYILNVGFTVCKNCHKVIHSGLHGNSIKFNKEYITVSLPKDLFKSINSFGYYTAKLLNKEIRLISTAELLRVIVDLANQRKKEIYTEQHKQKLK